MSRKNFKVATAENGETTLVKIEKTPTGKVKTLKDKEAIRKEREENYKNFRVNSLKRRAKRMGLSEEQTKVKIEQLLNQLSTPNSYDVLILYNAKDDGLVTAALQKEGLTCKIKSNSHLFIEADQETLATLREIMPPSAKIHPYTKKKPPVLPKPEPPEAKAKPRTKAEKKALAAATKLARKKKNIEAHLNRKKHSELRKAEHCKKMRAINKAKKLFEKRAQKASKKAGGTTVQLNPKKASNASKKASTVKKAA